MTWALRGHLTPRGRQGWLNTQNYDKMKRLHLKPREGAWIGSKMGVLLKAGAVVCGSGYGLRVFSIIREAHRGCFSLPFHRTDLSEMFTNHDVCATDLWLRVLGHLERPISIFVLFVVPCEMLTNAVTSSFSRCWQNSFVSPNKQIPFVLWRCQAALCSPDAQKQTLPSLISLEGGTRELNKCWGNSFLYNLPLPWFLMLPSHFCGHLGKSG